MALMPLTVIGDPGVGLNFLFGSNGNDTLNGGNTDSDVLNGGEGNDTLFGNGGNDILVFDRNDGDINGGVGFDILRIDDGAVYNTDQQSTFTSSFANATVDLRPENITNIEAILLTEEAVSDSGLGTTIQLTAQDVFDMTDSDHELYVIGSAGDKVDLTGDPATWVDTNTDVVSSGGQSFSHWTATISGNLVHLYLDNDMAAPVGTP